MTPTMVNTYTHLRDCAKPVSQQDAADLARIRAPQPPSKAHLKRLERHALAVAFVEPIPAKGELSENAQRLRRQRAFLTAQMAQIQPTRTLAPAEVFTPKRVTYVNVEHAMAEREFKYETQAERKAREDHLHDEQRRNITRKRLVAASKMVYQKHDPRLSEVLDAFGTVENYLKEIAK